MADGNSTGRWLLRNVLTFHLVAWAVRFVILGLYTIPLAWLIQVPLWVVIPLWLKRKAERGHTLARWLFSLMLAILAVGNAIGFASWAELPEDSRDGMQFTLSAVFAVGYFIAAVIVSCSPAVRRCRYPTAATC